jgi:outer membrane protein OmpA-like peptidoglycan-associated protein
MRKADRERELEDKMNELDERERFELKSLRASMKGGALTAEGVGRVLPDAVAISRADGARLPNSMVETTEAAIGLSTEQEPEVLSEALSPVIGPAIRKAAQRLLSELLFKLNAGLERGLAVNRIAWRLESLRTGVPYIEIVLRRTLEYRVEHAFLIHGKTSLLLADASRPGPSGLADKDMVASMLSAVRDYVKDSLSLSKGEAVDVLSAGDYSIFVEESRLALIALVVRGGAAPSVRTRAQEALETVHARLGPELRSFAGDTGPFAKAVPILARCLVSVEKGAEGKKPIYAVAALCAAAAIGAFFIARAGVQSYRDGAFVAALEAEPGMTVTEAKRSGGRLRASVMRASGAREVEAIAAERGFDLRGAEIAVETYLRPGEAPDSDAVPARAPVPAAAVESSREPYPAKAQDSSPSPTSRGPVPAESPRRPGLPSPAPSLAPPLASDSGNSVDELSPLVARLEAATILFVKNSSRPADGQDKAAGELRSIALSLVEQARKRGLEPRIEAIGHSAGAVRDAAGDSVSVARARAAVELLSRGAERLSPYLYARGVGNSEPIAGEQTAEGAARNRSASFTAVFR